MMDERLITIEQKIYEALASIELYEMKIASAKSKETSDYYVKKLNRAKSDYWSLIKKREKILKKIKHGSK